MAATRKIWITMGMGGDVETQLVPHVIRAYATKEAAAVAVAKSLGAKNELETKLRSAKTMAERHEVLHSVEASLLNRKITGEEWYEEVEFVEC